MKEEQITDTSWLSADWHEKEPKKKRQRRNVLPEAYHKLSKTEKQQVRAAARWIHERVSHIDWGRRMPDKKAGKPVPKPVNLKDQVGPYLQKNRGSWVRKLTLTAIIRHLLNDDTAFFTANSLGDETILMIDVDCHSSGTLQGATQFAEHLKQHYFPNLYIETSTNGNGAHGFVVVDKRLWDDAQYKATLKPVEEWLRRVLRSTEFDVEDVELKGAPLTVQWGARRGEVAGVTFGSLAKMPRDWKRFAEWESTTRMTPHDLRKLPEIFPVAEPEVVVDPEAQPVVRKGSVLGKLVDPEVVKKLEPLARRLIEQGMPQVKASSSRAVVVAEDVQMALAVVRACTLYPNPDGSLPLKRIWAIWDAAYEAGDTCRAFCYHRFKAIRDMLADMGFVEWDDCKYQFGRACKWRASDELMRMMEEALEAADTTTRLDPSIVDRNNLQEAIAEARRNRPEQVGLRPVRVFPSLLREDWDSKLTEAGLEHLARQAA